MEEATDLSQDNDDVMSELYGADRWGIHCLTFDLHKRDPLRLGYKMGPIRTAEF